MQTRRCEYKRWKTATLKLFGFHIFEMVAETTFKCGALWTWPKSADSWQIRHITEESHMELFSIVRPKQATSDEEAPARHVSSRDAEAMLGPSWMYTTVYRWYMLIHRWYPTFCWFPILPPDLKKKNPAFFDWTKMRVRRDRSFAVASFSAKELTFLLGTAGMWNHETLPYAVDLDISWHFLTYPTKPGCSRWSTAPAFVNQDILLGFPCHHKAFWKKIWKFFLSPTHTTVLCCYVVLLGVLSMDGVVDVGKCGSHRVSGTTNCATEEEEDMDDLKKSETWRQWWGSSHKAKWKIAWPGHIRMRPAISSSQFSWFFLWIFPCVPSIAFHICPLTWCIIIILFHSFPTPGQKSLGPFTWDESLCFQLGFRRKLLMHSWLVASMRWCDTLWAWALVRHLRRIFDAVLMLVYGTYNYSYWGL